MCVHACVSVRACVPVCACVCELKMICINQCWGMCGGGGEDGRGACRWGSPMTVMYIIVKGRKEKGGVTELSNNKNPVQRTRL